MFEQYGFVALTLALAIIAVSVLPNGYPAAFAIAAVAFGVQYFAPTLFGPVWFHEGFWAGLVFGGFLEYALFGAANGQSESAR